MRAIKTFAHIDPSRAAGLAIESFETRIDDKTIANDSAEAWTERERIKVLERENRELRRANKILNSAAVFFGAELDRRSPR